MTDNLKPTGDGVAEEDQLSYLGKILLGCGLLFLFFALIYLLSVLWPSGLSMETNGATADSFRLFGTDSLKFNVSVDVRLILLVAVAGALGSTLYAATAFVSYVGKGVFDRRWLWWYILRPQMGAALATIFYFAIRGGLFASGSNTGAMNVFGIAAISTLVGLFSKQATEKLDEVFQTLFRTGTAAKPPAAQPNPVPQIGSVARSADPKVLDVAGSNFIVGSKAQINGADRDTVFKDKSSLEVTIDASDSGDVKVVVVNPSPGGGKSNEVDFKIA